MFVSIVKYQATTFKLCRCKQLNDLGILQQADYILSHNVSVYLLLPYIYTFLSSDLTLTITYKDSVCEYTKQLSKHTKNRAT